MIGALRKNIRTKIVLGGIHIRYLQSPPGGFDIRSAELGHFRRCQIVLNKHGALVLSLVGRCVIRPPIQRIDGEVPFTPRGNDGIFHLRRLGIVADHAADVVLPGGGHDLRKSFRRFPRPTPSDGIGCNELAFKNFGLSMRFMTVATPAIFNAASA